MKSSTNLKKLGASRWNVDGTAAHGGRQRLDTSHTKKAHARKRPPTPAAELLPEHGQGSAESAELGPGPEPGAEELGPGVRSHRRTARGSAPWASRHAAKHAAEVAARNASPPPPGSARATLRTPEAADAIKERIGRLHGHLASIERLHRDLSHNFYEVGTVLAAIRDGSLYDAKGYSNFESFLDREISLGRVRALHFLRIADTFKREAALAIGLEALVTALRAVDESTALRPARPLGPPRLDATAKSSRR